MTFRRVRHVSVLTAALGVTVLFSTAVAAQSTAGAGRAQGTAPAEGQDGSTIHKAYEKLFQIGTAGDLPTASLVRGGPKH